MKTLTALEKQVMEMLLCGQDKVLAVLREQVNRLHISSREMTGVGFYTEFLVLPEAPRVPGCPTFKLGDVNGTADNLTDGLGFLLYIKDGALSMLEGYTYGEPWPANVEGLVLTYTSKKGRKLDFQANCPN